MSTLPYEIQHMRDSYILEDTSDVALRAYVDAIEDFGDDKQRAYGNVLRLGLNAGNAPIISTLHPEWGEISPREIFLREIVASPNDDPLRLAFANWLELNNDFERADFIRLQLVLESDDLPLGSETRDECLEEQRELLEKNRGRWAMDDMTVLLTDEQRQGLLPEYITFTGGIADIPSGIADQQSPRIDECLESLRAAHQGLADNPDYCRNAAGDYGEFAIVRRCFIENGAVLRAPHADYAAGKTNRGSMHFYDFLAANPDASNLARQYVLFHLYCELESEYPTNVAYKIKHLLKCGADVNSPLTAEETRGNIYEEQFGNSVILSQSDVGRTILDVLHKALGNRESREENELYQALREGGARRTSELNQGEGRSRGGRSRNARERRGRDEEFFGADE